ncbi:hypothetical protein G6F43_003153 [Rhizopus delemar]|nr:hypothetical protein G6F43_003153 [Rhizopus delemar]
MAEDRKEDTRNCPILQRKDLAEKNDTCAVKNPSKGSQRWDEEGPKRATGQYKNTHKKTFLIHRSQTGRERTGRRLAGSYLAWDALDPKASAHILLLTSDPKPSHAMPRPGLGPGGEDAQTEVDHGILRITRSILTNVSANCRMPPSSSKNNTVGGEEDAHF